jgi:hypothetical protein
MLISRILQEQGNLKLLYIPPIIRATYTWLGTARISIMYIGYMSWMYVVSEQTNLYT